MKRIKTIATTFLLAAALVLLPGSNALKAEAATPANYAVQYIEEDGGWRYQEGSTFDEDETHRELYYLLQVLKDGDKVAVYNDTSSAERLDLGSVKLSNLTICRTAMTVVFTGGIEECYVLAGSSCAINGDVNNAYVYDVATANFNNDVHTLIITSEGEDYSSSVACLGKVWHLHAYSNPYPKTFHNLYDFEEGSLVISDGDLETEYHQYTRADSVGTAPAPFVSISPAAPSTPSAPADEYDEVPKTGESALPYALLSVSVLCFAGSQLLRKKAN